MPELPDGTPRRLALPRAKHPAWAHRPRCRHRHRSAAAPRRPGAATAAVANGVRACGALPPRLSRQQGAAEGAAAVAAAAAAAPPALAAPAGRRPAAAPPGGAHPREGPGPPAGAAPRRDVAAALTQTAPPAARLQAQQPPHPLPRHHHRRRYRAPQQPRCSAAAQALPARARPQAPAAQPPWRRAWWPAPRSAAPSSAPRTTRQPRLQQREATPAKATRCAPSVNGNADTRQNKQPRGCIRARSARAPRVLCQLGGRGGRLRAPGRQRAPRSALSAPGPSRR